VLGITTPPPRPETPNIPLPASLPASATGLESALRDTLAWAAGNRPDTARSILQHLPQTGSGFTSGTMAFLQALSDGDMKRWLGVDTQSQLRAQGQNGLADRLGTEFLALRESFLIPPQNQWQMLLLPFVHNETLQQARLFTKREKRKESDARKNQTGDVRFVLEVSLSAMGDLQFDGLVRHPEQQSTQFDLVLRSTHPLNVQDRVEITRIFNEASELTGFKGTLAIQTVHEFPVKPLDEMVQGEVGSILA
jgi:hypothetical protein